jgi:hypothetical protein
VQNAESDSTLNVLLRAMGDLVGLLKSSGNEHWADWVDRDRQTIAGGDPEGLVHFLSAFGGMGSLNDVVIRREEGRALLRDEGVRANELLWEVRDRAWTSASQLKRELDSP